ncbi:alpha/beta fold hydrolase [Pedobacter sp. L105]|uniref:alpha/beta fold hydrolase n=1 Tax=Pedobacter sp. L105 TaxID=1641871 RepID=UPI00131B269A|nr:alpha/beta hydrolase [Pedobacter sp. L105]
MKMQHIELEGKQFAYYKEGQKDKPAILFLHGWPETSKIWEKIIPGLVEDYYILAIDLPGLGESDGLDQCDTGSVAAWIRKIVLALGVSHFNLVSHDIGSWVSTSYALKYPEDLRSLVLIDAGIPGILPDAFFSFQNHKKAWHFYFHAVADLPEFLIRGREKEYFSWFFTNKSHIKTAITESDIDYYAQLYKDKLSSGFGYYRNYNESVQINKNLLRKLPLPVLAIGGEFAVGDLMKDVAVALSENWSFKNVVNCGHFIPEEQPLMLLQILQSFLKPASI